MANSELKVLLNAYFERLFERLHRRQAACRDRIDVQVETETDSGLLAALEPNRRGAYREAAHSFLDERLETYNPIGVQYAFDSVTVAEAARMQMQLDWYDARAEYRNLLEQARRCLQRETAPRSADKLEAARLRHAADRLIHLCGAYPNASIIGQFRDHPRLNHLPDYIVACAIEAEIALA